jgi:VIT1/CCC1 family predicted Fe2+/Mn2+ transporter
MNRNTNQWVREAALRALQTETNEFHTYARLARICKNEKNRAVLHSLARAEKEHAEFWAQYTGRTARPQKLKVFWLTLLARLLGLTFALKRMEKGEGSASRDYCRLAQEIPQARELAQQEQQHERELLNLLNEDILKYAGSVVLGLNDALVELTGSLAGFTLALGDTRLISLAGLVTGVSASFSMAASEYLSCRADGNPLAGKSALYTGLAYVFTVALLILPFLLISSRFVALGVCLALAVVVIYCFNYYLSIAKDLPFRRRFTEMAVISLGVAALSFLIGWLLKLLLGV